MVGMKVTFHGVRGSTPYSTANRMQFGGNTCCVVVEASGANPMILDMGTGMFGYAQTVGMKALKATVLLTHLHWDHVAGLPFFSPVLCPGGVLDIYGPPDEGMTLEQAINRLITPPYFPVTLEDFAGTINIHDMWSDSLTLDDVTVRALPVPHTSATSGYRIEARGQVVVYVPDHQQPLHDATFVAPSVLELCADADLLIHDGQYPPDLFAERSNWGHSTPAYAIEVARQAGAKSLALFSHDPLHDDAALEEIEAQAQKLGAAAGIDSVFSAREGMIIEMG